LIKPELEEWAEVATFDVPGVGEEPAVDPLDRQAIIGRALLEVDRAVGIHTSWCVMDPRYQLPRSGRPRGQQNGQHKTRKQPQMNRLH
jgi:hypothetical protein